MRISPVTGRMLVCGLAAILTACHGDLTSPSTSIPDASPPLASLAGAATGAVTSRTDPTLCLAVSNGSIAPGSAVIVWSCDGSKSQEWTLTSSSELRIYDGTMCLDASGAVGKEGNPLIIQPCLGSASQTWEAMSNGELRTLDDECADAWGGPPRDGDAVVLNTCHGGSNQSWNFPAPNSGGVDGTPVDGTPADSTPVTSPTPTDPLSGTPIYPGESIQSAVDANPSGTRFVLAAGTYSNQHVVPKSGNTFACLSGAILDGAGSTTPAFEIGASPYPSNVTIRGCIVQNYNVPAQTGAIAAGRSSVTELSSGWVIDSCEVRENLGTGIRVGHRTRVTNNYVHHNHQLGIGGPGDSVVIQNNEIAFNNYLKQYDYGWEAGGTKFVLTHDLIVRNNYSHDNWGPGLWTDIDNINTLYEGNRVANNAGAGIFHEISYRAVIRNNTVTGNGSPSSGWLWDAGIQIAASRDVEVYGNTLSGNANGIGAMQQNRGSGAYGEHLVQNLYVHDNTVDMSTGGQSGLARDAYDDAIFTSWNNRFADNHYTLGANGYPFAWANGPRSVSEWQAYGQDLTGSFSQ